jgi:hypothetical protein
MLKQSLKNLVTLLAGLCCCASASFAQTPANPSSNTPAPAANRAQPCATRPEYRQFDFWIGDGTCRLVGSKPAQTACN